MITIYDKYDERVVIDHDFHTPESAHEAVNALDINSLRMEEEDDNDFYLDTEITFSEAHTLIREHLGDSIGIFY